MKRVLLLRHAKSDRKNHRGSDKERGLNDRGRKDAPRIAAELQRREKLPERIIASSALRVRETLALMEEVWEEMSPNVVYEDALYLASEDELMDSIQRQDEMVDFIALAAHNPGIENLYTLLSGERIDKFPTCAAALVEFQQNSWLSIQKGAGYDVLFLKPKNLSS